MMATKTDLPRQPTKILINGKNLSKSGHSNDKTRLGTINQRPGSRDRSPGCSSRVSPAHESAADQVMTINRRLLTQIETLRLKVEIDARHQGTAKERILAEANAKVKAGEGKLKQLKESLETKDEVVKSLVDENKQKEAAIQKLHENIKDLNDDVKISKQYANQIQSQLDELQSATASLQTGSAYTEKDEHIIRLLSEVEQLHKNLADLEKELMKAKERISKQGTQLRQSDLDKLNIQAKYKAELAMVTQTMRGDIERMRDVMKQQWEEMRDLREQNESMRADIREIHDLVLSNQQQVAQAQTPSFNQSRISGQVHSPFNLQPLKPTLPTLSTRDPKKFQSRPTVGRKKT